MKRDTIFLALMALLLATAAKAQQPERKLVEVWREGDYLIERYIVADNKPHEAEYEIHFAINSSTPNDTLADNTAELKSLDMLFDDMKDNKMMHLKSITVTGYASPDGTTAKNEELAKERAEHIAAMIAERYNLADSNIAVNSAVESWSDTAPAIEESKLDNRGAIVRMVSSNDPPMTIDNRLKHQGEAWQYMKNDILPDMRRAVVTVTYTEDQIKDSRIYSPEEVIIVEEVVVDKHHNKHHKEHNHHKRHERKKRHKMVDEWEGIIIDYGASDN